MIANNKKVQTVLITGSSSGIGYEFAKIFADHNYNLILIARNYNKLTDLKKEITDTNNLSVTIFSADLSDIKQVHSVYNYITENNITIDVLINNAGIGVYGEFISTNIQNEIEMINVNIVSLTVLTKFILIDMIKNNSGNIINVASTAAFKPGPYMSVYYATKSYVYSFSESISAEVKDTKVKITVLCPGPTNTKFMDKSSDVPVMDLKYKKMQTAYDVALYGYDAMSKNIFLAVPGISNRIITFLLKFFPRKAFADLMYKMKKQK